MNAQEFQTISAVLLNKHYGLSLNDTNLTEPEVVAGLIAAGVRPYEVMNEDAQDHDLYRVDIKGPWDTQVQKDLTAEDEEDAIAFTRDVFLIGEELPTCPKCGTRSEFNELPSGQQLHNCLNHNCKFTFLMEEDKSPEVESEEAEEA